MCWIRVSKLFMPPGISPYGHVFPQSAKRLVDFLFNNGLISYQRVNYEWGQLSIGRYPDDGTWYHIEQIVVDHPDYIARHHYFQEHRVVYSNIYFGLESHYPLKTLGDLPPLSLGLIQSPKIMNNE